MKRRLASLAGLFLLTSGVPLEHLEQPKASAEMKKILRGRLLDRYNLKVDDLKKLNWSEDKLREAAKHIDFEVFRLPAERGAFDAFKYRIFRSKSNNDYIIERSGGFAGVHELYVPEK